MKITTKVGTIAQVFSVFIKSDGVHNKKRATILMKTYVSVLFYRITQVNHVHSIHSINFGLFIIINWRAVNFRNSSKHWMEILAKIILPSHLASGSFSHCQLHTKMGGKEGR